MANYLSSLKGITRKEYMNNGAICHCTLDKRNEIKTLSGVLIPRYGEMTVRRKNTSSISFYSNGAVKRIALEQQTSIDTPLGINPAELVTFYKSGKLKRFFPLDGQISGYWSEQDEEGLLKALKLKLPIGELTAKIVGCCFYESGAVKSITLWPAQSVQVNISFGSITVRRGISFYENGAIKSLEPAYAVTVPTPIGMLNTFDATAVGINADNNSLMLDENGDISALTVPDTVFRITCDDGCQDVIKPISAIDPLDDENMIQLPIRVSFSAGSVIFEVDGQQKIFDLGQTQFTIESEKQTYRQCSGNCAQCHTCHS